MCRVWFWVLFRLGVKPGAGVGWRQTLRIGWRYSLLFKRREELEKIKQTVRLSFVVLNGMFILVFWFFGWGGLGG